MGRGEGSKSSQEGRWRGGRRNREVEAEDRGGSSYLMATARMGYEVIRSEVAKGRAGRKRVGEAAAPQGAWVRGPGQPGEQGWAILLRAI